MKRMPGFFRIVAGCAAAAALLAACGGSGGSGGDSGTAFEATVAGAGGASGKLSMTVAGTHASVVSRAPTAAETGAVAASGTLAFIGGATVALSGSCDLATGALSLSGGGYGVTCNIAGGEISGTYTAPGGGSGYVSGLDSSSGETRVFCGTYSGTRTVAPYNVHGVFNIVIGPDGTITGLGVDDMGKGGRVSGTLRGGSISASTDNGTSISGTLSGNSVSGTFSEAQSSGTWSGTRV